MHVKNLLKKIPLIFFSIGLVAASFFADQKLLATAEKPTPVVHVIERAKDSSFEAKQDGVYLVASGSSGRVTFAIGENALLRLAPETRLTLETAALASHPRQLRIALEAGRVWLFSEASTMETEFIAGKISATAEPGIFSVSYDGDTLETTARRGSALFTFLGNTLVLPEGREMSISHAKFEASGETIAKLRYSKLSKEFPYFEGHDPDEWEKKNQTDDEAFLSNYRAMVEQEIKEKGPGVPTDTASFLFTIRDLWNGTRGALTFDGQKKSAHKMALVLDYFDTGLFVTLVFDPAAGKQFFTTFGQKATGALDEKNTQELQKLADRFAFVKPGDRFYTAKKTVYEVLLAGASLQKMHTDFRDIGAIAASGNDAETQVRLQTALRNFGAQAENQLKGIASDDAQNLFWETIRFNDFLNRHPALLREEFLTAAGLFEKRYLALLSGAEQADEQRQFLIAEKLKRLRVLKGMLEREEMPFQDGRKSILLIATDIEALKPNFSDAAVLTYFEEQLQEFTPLVAFLRSSAAESKTGNFQENFEDFIHRQDEVKRVTDLLASASGGTQISAVRREELGSIVTADFSSEHFSHPVSNIQIGLPESENDPRVSIIHAELEGSAFSATYDTSGKVFSTILINGENISYSIRLQNFEKFFLIKIGKLVVPTGVTVESLAEAPPKESLFEKITKEKLLADLKKMEVVVEDKYLGFEDLSNDIVHVRLARINEGAEAMVFSFDVSDKGSVIGNLKVQTVSGEIPVNDRFGLAELPITVQKVYQRAVFEKERAEELDKVLNPEKPEQTQ